MVNRLFVLGAVMALSVVTLPVAAGASNGHGPDVSATATNVRIAQDAASGRVRSIAREGGFLTGPSNAAPVSIARRFLAGAALDMGFGDTGVADLKLTKQYTTAHNGARHLVFHQVDGDRVVYGSSIIVTLDRRGRVVFVGGDYFLDTQAKGSVRLSGAQALQRVAVDAGVDAPARLHPTGSSKGVTTYENAIAESVNGPSDLSAEMVTFADESGARLAWKTIAEIDQFRWYETVVDAETGAILSQINYYADSGPEGLVFTDQNPDVSDPEATVPFSGIDGSWVTDRETIGNNVDAYEDLFDDDDPSTPSNPRPITPASPDPDYQHFDFAFTDAWRTGAGSDPVNDLATDRDAAVVQLFYYVNRVHDYLYALGFDEASGNFQTDNFGRGGADGDPVNAEAHDGYGTGTEKLCTNSNGDPILCRNNANFGTPTDGNRPRMQMFVWEPTRPWRDGAMDGDVIAHEYGHGLSKRLVGGGTLGGGTQTGALGEGWSDTNSFLMWGDAVIGEYVTGNAATGIRGVAYDSSSLVYSDFVPGGSVHSNGRIMASTMYDLLTAMQDRYGPAGYSKTEFLFVDGLKNTVTSPSYLDYRDGVLAADVLNSGGANTCLIWSVFAGREMGFSATSSGDQTTIVTATDGPPACTPTADANGPYTTPEGTNATLDGTGSVDPTVSGLTYEWDLDNDGQYDDAAGANPVFDAVGQDGFFTVGLRVTANDGGFTDEDTTTVTVTNVAPSVSLATTSPADENTSVSVSGVISDPGWLESLTGTIDWDDGGPPEMLTGVLENVRPDATLTFDMPHTYGDNGVFSVEVCGYDDDTSTCETIDVTIDNVDPTVDIDESGTVMVNGNPTIVTHAGDPVPFEVRSQDPGSDDLTIDWDWDDGPPVPDVTTTYLVNPPILDPLPSPSIQPRDVTDTQIQAFAEACLYEVGVSSLDDDAGSAADSIWVLITGNADQIRSAGYWYNQYKQGPAQTIDDATLECYLEIAEFMSNVFDERRDVSTIDKAEKSLKSGGRSMLKSLDRQLLATLLNFANGSLELDQLVDTDFDLVPDTALYTVIVNAETVRLDPLSTKAQLEEQKNILEAINLL